MIKLKSIYDIKALRAFQRYTLSKIFILGYACGLAFIGVGIWFAFASRDSYIIYLLSGVLLPFLLHVFYRYMEIDATNKNKYIKDTTIQIFTFDEKGFALEQNSRYDIFSEAYEYSNILSIIKYKRYYFIYINRSQAFVVSNEDYLMGNEKELDALFKKVKGKRFIVKRNSKRK